MFSVPLQNSTAQFELQIALDGTTYTLAFEWNVSMEAWFFGIQDADSQVQYLDGLCMRCGANIAYNLTGKPFPGYFKVRDTSGLGIDPGFTDLGTRVLLYYVTGADLKAITSKSTG